VRRLIEFSVKNRALVVLVTVVSAVFGAISLTHLQQDLMPKVASPAIAIVTEYDGATVAVVDKEVSRPVEKAVRSVDGITSSSTISASGVSLVSLKFAIGTDLPTIEQRIAKALSTVKSTLPLGTDPRVRAGSIDDLPIMQVAISAPDGTAPDSALRTSVTGTIEKIEGVRAATFLGGVDSQLSVTPRTADTDRYGVTSLDLAEAIQSRAELTSGGEVRANNQSIPIQIGRSIDSVEAVLDIPLAVRTGEPNIRIRDVADAAVVDAPRTTIARVDGERALVLSIEKLPGANTVEIAEQVDTEIASMVRDGTIVASTTFDQAPSISEAVESTTVEGLIGLVCAVVVVFAFLVSIRMTLIAAVSMPVSLLLASIAMQGAGYTLNIVTLGALTVAIGRLVDDSIVVIDSIERELEVSEDRAKSIVDAVGRVASAVIASTLTTIAVFAPLAFIGGATGALFRPFAVTASVALLASLFVSLTIVPVLSYWLLGRSPARKPAEMRPPTPADRLRLRLEGWYRPCVKWAIRHAPLTIAVSLIAMIGSAFLVPGMATSYLAGAGETSIHVTQKESPSVTIDSQEANVDAVETTLRDVDGVEAVRTTLGSSGNVLRDAALGGGAGLASYILTLDDDVPSAEVLADVRTELAKITDRGTFAAGVIEDVGFSSDLEVSITALDRETLRQAATTLSDSISGLKEVSEVSDTQSPERSYVDVLIDDEAAAAHGLTDREVTAVMQAATGDRQVSDAIVGDSEIPVVVSGTTAASSVEDVAAVQVPTPSGFVPFSSIGTVATATAPLVIQTESGLLSAKLIVSPAHDDLGGATAAVQKVLDDADVAAGVTFAINGAAEEQGDAFGQLFIALTVSILIVYTIMVATFRSLLQPLLLLVSVPFAVIGALVAQRLSGETFGVASLVGLLMLIGIVVTNAIVLVDRVNQLRAEGVQGRAAIVEGATGRVRAIVMTALATILALSPMALGITGHAGFISRPMAIVVIGGLVSSTVLTLIVLPSLLSLELPSRRAHGVAGSGVRSRRHGRSSWLFFATIISVPSPRERAEVIHELRATARKRIDRTDNVMPLTRKPHPKEPMIELGTPEYWIRADGLGGAPTRERHQMIGATEKDEAEAARTEGPASSDDRSRASHGQVPNRTSAR
jgi:HAE1 family hydrophobic/amphiphilic exporter-1